MFLSLGLLALVWIRPMICDGYVSVEMMDK